MTTMSSGLEPADGVWATDGLPGIPASAGALVFDGEGRLLVLRPTYKSGWTIPGGVMEDTGETPWQACQREVLEETGLVVTTGRLACVDTRPARARRAMGLRFLFDCGRLPDDVLEGITLQTAELSEHRFVPVSEALALLRPAVSRRVAAAVASEHCCYLEDGLAVTGVIA
jgi:ADP-ribose pyrophosphatase YjhB (NUDIX family)